MKPYLALLPYRLYQAAACRPILKRRIERRRRRTAPTLATESDRRKRLYIDLAVISRDDAGTGIQRVVRALGLALMENGSAEWDIRFVAANRHRAYHTISWPPGDVPLDPEKIEGRHGDVFLGLDFSVDAVRWHRRQLAQFRSDGGSLWFLIFDLLPIERPEWFSPNNVTRYKAWLEIIGGLADGFLCISKETELDLRRILDERFGLTDDYRTAVLPMGFAIMDSVLCAPLADAPNALSRVNTSAPFLLMVGTLEPRKGHADVLAAFNELWRAGRDHRLVLVGHMGWHTEGLRHAIRTHPEHGRKLLWFDDVEDPELERIYKSCEGVIVASHAEGFGLPLIEALGHEKPVLARDLPIFRIHEACGVRYFPTQSSGQALAECILTWTDEVRAGRVTIVRPNTGWKQSARTLLSVIA